MPIADLKSIPRSHVAIDAEAVVVLVAAAAEDVEDAATTTGQVRVSAAEVRVI